MQQSNFQPSDFGGPRIIPENLGGPKISTNPLDFGTVQQGSSKTLGETLINPNNATLIWNMSVTYVPAGASWLSSNLLSGTIPPLGQQDLSVTANASILAPGTYAATLNFSGNFSPNEQVQVNLVVDGQPSGRETPESASTFRIRITEEPLTAQNFTVIMSALTELHTKCWLTLQGRFTDLIEYTQTHNARFAEEANLIIVQLTHNSPAEIKFNTGFSFKDIGEAAKTIAEALKIVIDAIAQAPQRLKAAKLENQLKEVELKQKEVETQLAQQKGKIEVEKQQIELEKQKIELQRERLEVETKQREYMLETASKMVDVLQPSIDAHTKLMLAAIFQPNLLQLGDSKGLAPVLPTSKMPKKKH